MVTVGLIISSIMLKRQEVKRAMATQMLKN